MHLNMTETKLTVICCFIQSNVILGIPRPVKSAMESRPSAVSPFPLSSWLHGRHSRHKIWSQRHSDCKHPNSILGKDSGVYSEVSIVSNALESLICNNHFHPNLIHPGVCSLLLRTMCLSISLGWCFLHYGDNICLRAADTFQSPP